MECYRCNETDPDKLSVKKTQRGKKTYICRPCRNNMAMSRSIAIKPASRSFDLEAWTKQAKESRLRIVANHS